MSRHWDWEDHNVSVLLGLTLVRCEKVPYESDEAIDFETSDGRTFRMYHAPDCCESVHIESINGDLADLVGMPLTLAECAESPIPDDHVPIEESSGDEEWSFYRFATAKGFVDVRWYGTSNGYYSTSVSFALVVEGSC